jgi:tRNA (adenine57-N1/adenine58-N1)-methyltransferase catalytic subunit
LTWNLHGTHAQENDLVELVGLSHKHFIILLKAGGELHTHRGVVYHNDLIGTAWGSQIHSHSGSPFFMLQPALNDLLRSVPRRTQIMYPKEIGYILVALGIGPGQHVIEAGTGSGALTTALAYAVGTTGKVISYEARPEMQEVARKNLERFGLADRVDFKIRDIGDGFDETGVDSLFLDVANSYDYMHQVRMALKPGGFFGSILPTTNQVTKLLYALRHEDFAFTEVLEIMLRFYKPEPDKLRPTDRMIAHTGFLIFARPVIIDHAQESESPLIEEEWEADNDL